MIITDNDAFSTYFQVNSSVEYIPWVEIYKKDNVIKVSQVTVIEKPQIKKFETPYTWKWLSKSYAVDLNKDIISSVSIKTSIQAYVPQALFEGVQWNVRVFDFNETGWIW